MKKESPTSTGNVNRRETEADVTARITATITTVLYLYTDSAKINKTLVRDTALCARVHSRAYVTCGDRRRLYKETKYSITFFYVPKISLNAVVGGSAGNVIPVLMYNP